MKNIRNIIPIVVSAVLLAAPVLAATDVTLSPASATVSQGKTFTVSISVNPNAVKNYTVKAQLNYPADLLEVTGFTFAPTWMQLSQPGYDSIDNTNGVLIKTAGYPQGTASNVVFGTATFKAKKAGIATVSTTSGTLAYNQSSQNVFSGTLDSTTVVIGVTSTPTSTPAQTIVGTVKKTTVAKASVTPAPQETVTTSSTVAPETQQASLFAAIGNVLDLGTGKLWLGILILIAIAGVAYGVIKRARRK